MPPDFCFSADTFVVTQNGIVPYTELEPGVGILCLDLDTGLLEYHKLKMVKTNPSGGFLTELSCATVTPGHTMVSMTADGGYTTLTAESCTNGGFTMPVLTDDHREVVGIYISGGTTIPYNDTIFSLELETDHQYGVSVHRNGTSFIAGSH